MKWYKRDPEAFAGGTAELSLEEVGAYTRVIDLIYSRDGNVPDDEMFLARALRCDVRVWRRIRARLVVTGKISTSAGLIVNLRATSEISYAQVRMKKDRKRNENKESNLTSDPILTTTTTTREEKEASKVVALRAPQSKGTRLPDNWNPSEDDLRFAQQEGVSGEDLRVQIAKFRNYWTSKSGRDASKINWPRTWENWILDGRQRNGKRSGGGGAGRASGDFLAGIAKVAANIPGDGELARSADEDVPLGRFNIDG